MDKTIFLTPGDTIRVGEAIYECRDDQENGGMHACASCDMISEDGCKLPKKYNCFPFIIRKQEE